MCFALINGSFSLGPWPIDKKRVRLVNQMTLARIFLSQLFFYLRVVFFQVSATRAVHLLCVSCTVSLHRKIFKSL